MMDVAFFALLPVKWLCGLCTQGVYAPAVVVALLSLTRFGTLYSQQLCMVEMCDVTRTEEVELFDDDQK